MTRTLSFIPSPADTWLEIGEVPRASPLILTGPAPLDHESYMAQIWRRRTSVHSGSPPLATAYGSGSSGVASVIFSASQLALTLTADSGDYDDFWLTVSAVQQVDSQPVALRGGWLRVGEWGFDPLADSFSAEVTFVVVDDVAYITYLDVFYLLPVALIGPTGVDSGIITVSEDTLYFNYEGQRWGAPSTQVMPPPGAADGEGVVIDDVLYVTLAGISHTAPVIVGEAPPVPPGPGEEPSTTLVTGGDGAQYEKTTYPDGTVRYKPVYESIPGGEVEPPEPPAGTSISVSDGIAAAVLDGVTYQWPVTSADGDISAGTGEIQVVDGIATLTLGGTPLSWAVSGTPGTSGAAEPFSLSVTAGIGTFSAGGNSYSYPVTQ